MKPGGRMLEVFKGGGGYTNQREHNGLPRPHRECIVGPYVKTCMFKKHILKIRKFFIAGRYIVRTFLPLLPPPIARQDVTSNLSRMRVMEPSLYVEPGGGF